MIKKTYLILLLVSYAACMLYAGFWINKDSSWFFYNQLSHVIILGATSLIFFEIKQYILLVLSSVFFFGSLIELHDEYLKLNEQVRGSDYINAFFIFIVISGLLIWLHKRQKLY